MKVLVVGNGGREHALAWKIAASPRVDRVFVAPGNAGTAAEAENVPIAADDIPALVKFVKENAIELTVVVIGIALGGTFGVATFAFALLVGYCLAMTVRLLEKARARNQPLIPVEKPRMS